MTLQTLDPIVFYANCKHGSCLTSYRHADAAHVLLEEDDAIPSN